MAAERRLALARRFSLAGISEGWSDDCYLNYLPTTYRDLKTLQALKPEGMSEEDGADKIVEFVKQHVTGGQGLFANDSGDEPALDKLTADDVDLLPPATVRDLFSEMTGAKLADPKGTPPAALNAAQQPPAGPSTETLSSTPAAQTAQA